MRLYLYLLQLFLAENELKVHIISTRDLRVEKEVKLEKIDF